jgi:hypothetical protein
MSSSTPHEAASSINSPEYDRGFTAGVKSQEIILRTQKEKFKNQTEELKREVRNLKKRMEDIEGKREGSGSKAKTDPPRGKGAIRRESFAEHEARIREVERSFGI